MRIILENIQWYSIAHFHRISIQSWQILTKLEKIYWFLANSCKIWNKIRKFVIQDAQKCQNRRLTRKKIQKIKKKSLSNRLTQKSKKLRPFKFITHDFFRVHLISKNFEIFMESWGEVSWYHIYRNNNHKLLPPLKGSYPKFEIGLEMTDKRTTKQ